MFYTGSSLSAVNSGAVSDLSFLLIFVTWVPFEFVLSKNHLNWFSSHETLRLLLRSNYMSNSLYPFWGFPVAQLCLQCRRCGFNPRVGKIPWRRERLPTPVFWPGEFHGVVHGVIKSWTWLSDFHFHLYIFDFVHNTKCFKKELKECRENMIARFNFIMKQWKF